MSIFKPHIDAMGAYAPPLDGRDAQSHLLLDFNERTVPVVNVVQEALIEYIKSGRLQMYPSYGDITQVIANYCQVPAEQVMITNGSDQGIDLIIRSACNANDEVIIPAPSFPMYSQCAKIENAIIRAPEYSKDGGFPTQAVIDAVRPDTKVICIANPNNPSGTVVPREDIIAIAKTAPKAAILVDECYFEYFGETVADLVDELPNLVVTRTFSKTWGIPSLRLGYVISAKQNIDALLNVRGPYDVNQLAVVAVRAALSKPELTQAYVREVMDEAKPVFEAFLQNHNVEYWPSGANFIWAFPKNAKVINEQLTKENILVRPKPGTDGKLGLRITIGTVEQTQRLMAVMAPLL